MSSKIVETIKSYLKTINFLAFIFTGIILIFLMLFTLISYINLSEIASLEENLRYIIILILIFSFFYFNFLTITSGRVSALSGAISLFYILGVAIGGSIMFTLIGTFIFSIFF